MNPAAITGPSGTSQAPDQVLRQPAMQNAVLHTTNLALNF